MRFSLFTLVLLSLWFGTGMLVWQRREPWVKTHVLKHSANVGSMRFFPDSRRLLVCTWENNCVWDIESGEELGRLTGGNVAISPDGSRIATWRESAKEVSLWDGANFTLLRTLQGNEGYATDGEFSPDGKSFLLATREGEVRRWALDAVEPPEIYYTLLLSPKGLKRDSNPPSGVMNRISYSPDGKLFLAYGDVPTVFVFSVESGRVKLELDGDAHSVSKAHFSSDGTRIVTSTGWRVRLWRASDGQLLKTIRSTDFEPPVLAPDSSWFVARDNGDTSTLYSLKTGDMIVPLDRCRGNPKFVGVDLASRRVATIESDVQLWDTHTGQRLHSIEGTNSVHTKGAQSRDGQVLAASINKQVWLWLNRHPEWWWGHFYRVEVWVLVGLTIGIAVRWAMNCWAKIPWRFAALSDIGWV